MHPVQVVFVLIVLCLMAYVALEVLGRVARRYVVVTPIHDDEAEPTDIMSHQSTAPAAVNGIVPSPQCADTTATTRIAMPHNGHNAGIVHCAHTTALADALHNDPAIVSGMVTALVRVMLAERDGKPLLSQTAAIRYGLGINPGGSNPLYELARAAIRAELARQRGAGQRDEIADVAPDGTVIRQDPTGNRYAVDRQTGEAVPLPPHAAPPPARPAPAPHGPK